MINHLMKIYNILWNLFDFFLSSAQQQWIKSHIPSERTINYEVRKLQSYIFETATRCS